jgi:hypothetical protein
VKPSPFDPEATRSALARLPEIAAQESLTPPPLSHVYVPFGHQRALSLDSTVVVGMRGAGKSLWTAVLSSSVHKNFVAAVSNSAALAQATVRVGFGLDETSQHFPTHQTLAQLVASGVDAFTIWKVVVVRHALGVVGASVRLPGDDWLARGLWAAKNPQKVDALLSECDETLAKDNRVLLVLFDALDRLATDWDAARELLSGALRLGLACRARQALRTKFFLRPDMDEDAEIWKFADSSKLRHAKVELSWRTSDLYALVMTYLANDSQFGSAFRKLVGKLSSVSWQQREAVFPVPRPLLTDEKKLREIVEAIAGPWMGRSHKRGFTYTWIPTHLADAAGRVSPRSFLLTFRKAAEASSEQYADHPLPLHFEAIHQGVTLASQIRIAEIEEDYPWVKPLLEAARGLSVPCTVEELLECWTPQHLVEVRKAASKLPPRRFTTDPNRHGSKDVLIDDLVELAVLYRTEDGRLNMPDIFRVGFGVKRKGGVKPPQ